MNVWVIQEFAEWCFDSTFDWYRSVVSSYARGGGRKDGKIFAGRQLLVCYFG
jgi:hypothetical protein